MKKCLNDLSNLHMKILGRHVLMREHSTPHFQICVFDKVRREFPSVWLWICFPCALAPKFTRQNAKHATKTTLRTRQTICKRFFFSGQGFVPGAKVAGGDLGGGDEAGGGDKKVKQAKNWKRNGTTCTFYAKNDCLRAKDAQIFIALHSKKDFQKWVTWLDAVVFDYRVQ